MTHSILVGSPGPVYGKMITQLHAWNPAVKVLVYDLGPYTTGGSAEYTTLMAQHPEYFARDSSGHLITVKAASGSPAFSNNYLMDEANPGWQAEEASRILTNINKYGFDGGYVDSMGPGPFSGTTTGVPIDPSTGQAFSKTSWMQAAGQTLSVIKAAIGSKYLFSTGLVNGSEFASFTHYLSDSTVDGVQTELVAPSGQLLADAVSECDHGGCQPRDGADAQRAGQGLLRMDQGLDLRDGGSAVGVERVRACRLPPGG